MESVTERKEVPFAKSSLLAHNGSTLKETPEAEETNYTCHLYATWSDMETTWTSQNSHCYVNVHHVKGISMAWSSQL